MDKIRRNWKAVLVFVLPGFMIYTLLLMIPIFGSGAMSLLEWNGIKGSAMNFVGLENFKTVLSDSGFWLSVKNIFWWLILVLIVQLPGGLLIAVMLSSHFKGYRFFKATYFVPQVLSTTVVGLVWTFIFMPNGVLNNTLAALGLEALKHTWLVEPETAITSIIMVNNWAGIGFHMTVCYAGIQAIPDEIMEAASLDGCVGIKKIIRITIPMIWETIISSLVVIVTAVVKQFDLVYVMTGGGPNGLTEVPSTLLYKQAFKYSNYGVGSAIGFLVFVASIVLTLLSLRITKREKIEL